MYIHTFQLEERHTSQMIKLFAQFAALPAPDLSSFKEWADDMDTPVMALFKTATQQQGKCFQCGQMGHWRNECPQNLTRFKRPAPTQSAALPAQTIRPPKQGGRYTRTRLQQSANVRCYTCGKTGHVAKECRSRAQPRGCRGCSDPGHNFPQCPQRCRTCHPYVEHHLIGQCSTARPYKRQRRDTSYTPYTPRQRPPVAQQRQQNTGQQQLDLHAQLRRIQALLESVPRTANTQPGISGQQLLSQLVSAPTTTTPLPASQDNGTNRTGTGPVVHEQRRAHFDPLA